MNRQRRQHLRAELRALGFVGVSIRQDTVRATYAGERVSLDVPDSDTRHPAGIAAEWEHEVLQGKSRES